ncbi:hypothetical protein KCH_76460 [Kitasatospora cheerisanensis KCTC 2395]|uniref:Uncharacterized protein n=1 Tax=Kitasatospora cheerisanensis KCTC 2395 TaxID=1348663 RepID=A0A066YHI7_9ACTN|nr:hypothetical protein KCH_76460 [Kitasatospora cheerisanensis KCTC 2395]
MPGAAGRRLTASWASAFIAMASVRWLAGDRRGAGEDAQQLA